MADLKVPKSKYRTPVEVTMEVPTINLFHRKVFFGYIEASSLFYNYVKVKFLKDAEVVVSKSKYYLELHPDLNHIIVDTTTNPYTIVEL